MLEHARNLEFEQAARVRDQLALLKDRASAPGRQVAENKPLATETKRQGVQSLTNRWASGYTLTKITRLPHE